MSNGRECACRAKIPYTYIMSRIPNIVIHVCRRIKQHHNHGHKFSIYINACMCSCSTTVSTAEKLSQLVLTEEIERLSCLPLAKYYQG